MAEEKIEKAIDVICCYSTSKVPIKTDFTDLIVLNENKKMVSTSFTIEGTEFEREVKGLNFDYDNVEELEKLYKNYSGSVLKCTTRIAETIQDSGRWYRKGEDIKRKEDKLMNYWISLENLIPNDMILPEEIKKIKGGKDNKFMIAYSVIPELFIKKHIMDELWVYYMHFYNKYKYKNSNISKELKDKCQFGYQGEINILYFIKSIDELIANEKNEFDKGLLQNVKDNITSNTKKFIQNIISKERNIILLSYRMRNMIVHNAKCNMYFNEYYIYNLRNYTRELFYLIVEEYNKNLNDTVEDIIYRQYIQQKETDFNKINIIDFINDYQ